MNGHKEYRHSNLLIGFLIAFCLSFSAFASVDSGLQWLTSQNNADGSYASVDDIATPYQATAETLQTFAQLDRNSLIDVPAALAYINANEFNNTEYLARKIIVNAGADNQTTALVDELKAMADRDGGFGEFSGFQSTVLDTVFALKALSVSGQSLSQEAAFAISYLQAQQNQAGAYAFENNQDSLYLTALVSIALQDFQHIYALSQTIQEANNSLLAQMAADGSIGEAFESALALQAIAPLQSNQALLQPLIDYMTADQQANGSWANDAYVTALAIKALFTAQTVTPPQPDKATLVGSVKDGLANQPIANAFIAVNTADGQSITINSDNDGRFLISNIAAGNTTFSIGASGYFSVTTTGTLIAGEVFTLNVNLIADPQANPLSLRGSVFDKQTGLAIAGAQIQVQNSNYSSQTDSQGDFQLNNLPAGSVTVEVSKTGYFGQMFSIVAASGGIADLGRIELEQGTGTGATSQIKGLITDAITENPLRGVLITISGTDNESAFTDLDGRFLFNEIAPGNIVITASFDGYQDATGSTSLPEGTALQFNAAMIKTAAPGLLALQGHVVDADTQAPLAGVLVSTATGVTSTTDSAGAFYLGGLEQGSISLSFEAVGYISVTYSLTAQGGGLIDLSTIALAPDIPITGNQPPQITSIAPTHAAVGNIYEYQIQALDPEGDTLSFGLSQHPSGMDINTSGLLRWIPTTDQAGEQSFNIVVSDNGGAITQQSVLVTVTDSGDPSYVITDVETLNGLTVDAVLPDNYILGNYVAGGTEKTWRAISSEGCGFDFQLDSTGAAAKSAAANVLDFWAVQPHIDKDVVWDLGIALSTLSVLPLIDHEPFPQEGIEYTVWGSDDADAVFPEGWTLATLVTIYRQGWADNAIICGDGINIDDYAGLYTFGQDQYRYIRVKAANSISIFDTPEHTTYSTERDDSGLPGWQSNDAEIDGVVGMLCEVTPQANAGADILGVTRNSIVFDETASQGNIVTYGWDLDGDSEIDLTGVTPEHIFNAGFDGDVSLLVVDDRGCVGTDTVHVTIDLDFPKPDLVVSAIDTTSIATNLQTLAINGSVALTIANQGSAPALDGAEVTLFEDSNGNGQYDFMIDQVLGVQTMSSGLAKDRDLSMTIAVNGNSLFRDSPILAKVDSNQQINETREDNNIASSANSCSYIPTSLGDFDFVEKWYWFGSVFGPVNVAQLSDDNGDGLINEADIPDVIFTTSSGGIKGNLVALDGSSGEEIWRNTSTTVTVFGSPAIGDIDGDGLIEIIIPNQDRTRLYAFEHDGTLKWS